MPIAGEMQLEKCPIDDGAVRAAAEQPTSEEQLGSTKGPLASIGISGGAGIDVQCPQRDKALPERRHAAARSPIAVPAAVGPLGTEQSGDEAVDPLVGQSQPQ